VRQRQDKVLEILDSHGEGLHRLISRITRCEHATSDLMQELFLRLSKSKGLDKAHDPGAYAWRAAANLAIDWRRRKRPNIAPFDPESHAGRTSHTEVARIVREEQIERVLAATAKLDELARNVVIMRFIEQESYERIAVRLGKNPNHLRSLCSKALARLRKILAEGDDVQREKGASYA